MAATINDSPFSWADIRTKVGSRELIGYKSIKYGDKCSTEAVYGARRHMLGRTRGKVEVDDGTITMFEHEARDLLEALGDGWADKVVDSITVQYGNEGTSTHTDVLEKVRFVGLDGGGDEGTSALEREVSFTCMRIKRDGRYIVAAAK